MINYIRHNQIDKIRWDDCISRSVNRKVYAFSWYLDLVCPGWDALVANDYSSVFPLTHHRKWAISYLAQPYFAQQLGIFSPDEISEKQVAGFIQAIPDRFKFVEIHLNSMNRYTGREESATTRINYELDLASDYQVLAGKYSQNVKRNLRKSAESELTLNRSTTVDDLIGLFRENFGEREGKLQACHYETLRKLMHYCMEHNQGYILSSNANNGVLSAAAFFLFDQARVYYLFAASGSGARENGAMFLLIDRFIYGNAGKPLILDFEGGNDQNLGRFYKSFGAMQVLYPVLRLNRLSKLEEGGLYFMRKLRK